MSNMSWYESSAFGPVVTGLKASINVPAKYSTNGTSEKMARKA